MLSFFTLLFHLHQELFSSSSLSAIRVVSSAYLRLLVFLSATLIPVYVSSSPAFHMMCSGGSEVKASASDAGDPGSIPGLGRSPGEGNGNPLQYSCLENPMDGEAYSPRGCKELDTTERLHLHSAWKLNKQGDSIQL